MPAHALAPILVLLVFLTGIIATGAQETETIEVLNQQYWKLFNEKRLVEASEVAKRRLELLEKTPETLPKDLDEQLYILGTSYIFQGRYAEAEPLLKRRHELREPAYGFDSQEVVDSLRDLTRLYRHQGRLEEVERLHARRLNTVERLDGPDHLNLVPILQALAEVASERKRSKEKTAALERVLSIVERTHGTNHLATAEALASLADGKDYEQSAALHERVVAIREKLLGSDHDDVKSSLRNLVSNYVKAGIVRNDQGEFAEAEPLHRRTIQLLERLHGAASLEVTVAINDLATSLDGLGKYVEAERLAIQSLTIREAALGPDHPNLGTPLAILASLNEKQGRKTEAEQFLLRRLGIYRRALAHDHQNVFVALEALTEFYKRQGRSTEALPLLDEMVKIMPRKPDLFGSKALAALSQLAKENVGFNVKIFGADSPIVSTARHSLAMAYFNEEKWDQSVEEYRLLTRMLIKRDRFERHAVEGRSGQKQTDSRERFEELISTLWHLASTRPGEKGTFTRESFLAVQRARDSEVGASLAQMAARSAARDGALGHLVRERQDLLLEWHQRDAPRVASMSLPPEARDLAAEAVNRTRLSAIESRLAKVNDTINIKFPSYGALANPEPVTVPDLQGQLGSNEALVLFLDLSETGASGEEMFVWVVTRTHVRWVRVELGTSALVEEVSALRCGLDAAAWHEEAGKRCARLLNMPVDKIPSGNEPLGFDINRAHALYNALFAQVADLIKNKHLLIVPSGALMQLPFQVLVTEKPEPVQGSGSAYRQAAWLVKGNAISVLPAVSSLQTLRRHAKASRATKAFIGFGNPLLDGTDRQRALDARERQQCADGPRQRVARVAKSISVAVRVQRGGKVDIADVLAQEPLPETADELCAVARGLNAPVADIRLGTRASEGAIRDMSDAGSLAQYRVVHFATHGMLAGELTPGAEPGLILTPPEKANQRDDGYLSASEVAALKLDADFVILSACNTAGAAGPGSAEALSGLARAFFYAGARAILVSHWAVYSDSTVKLITGALRAMVTDKRIGRAEALRRSMLALINKGEPKEAHPAYWAPFVVVGEGGAAR